MEWILWSPSRETGLLVIPEEVELLIPMVRSATTEARVHLLTYAAPVTKNMLHFSNLQYFTIPALPSGYQFPKWLRLELGLFAGCLYASYDNCLEIMDYLKKPMDEHGAGSKQVAGAYQHRCTFTEKPIGFLLEWLALRRQVQDVLRTPIGYVCQGRPLHRRHPFFLTKTADGPDLMSSDVSTGSYESETHKYSHEDDTSDWSEMGKVDYDDQEWTSSEDDMANYAKEDDEYVD